MAHRISFRLIHGTWEFSRSDARRNSSAPGGFFVPVAFDEFYPPKKSTEFSWLVVDLPLWKIWVRQLGLWHSQWYGKIKNVWNHQPVSVGSSQMGLFPHMTSVQNPSIIRFNPGCFFFWIPRSWIIMCQQKHHSNRGRSQPLSHLELRSKSLVWTFIFDQCILDGGFNHLEKYEFVNGKDDIPYMKWKIIHSCLKPPTRFYVFSWSRTALKMVAGEDHISILWDLMGFL